ncbi:MAG: amidohydrolase family protein [Longimicrobiales bacterium]|nr:amidohydrolase family protein [Longimicrobiales bacterium]
MKRHPILLGALVLTTACGPGSDASPDSGVVAFTGATVWDGTGSPPLEDATLLVDAGRVVSLGTDVEIPQGATEIDLAGTFVTPGLVNAHGHVSGRWAHADVSDEIRRVYGDLELFARYGVTTVNSLGDGEVVLAAKDSASPMATRARLRAAGPVITASDPEEAREAAEANATAGADWLKLRVDDNLGTTEKMPWDAVTAVLEVGEARHIPVATHVFYLEDARRLLSMGTDMIAHSVRDVAVDEGFVEQLRASGACYVPTLTRELSTFVYADRPDFFDDPFFTRHALATEVERLSEPDFMAAMSESRAAAGYREALNRALENLIVLAEAGVAIGMGTDAGPPGRFPGYFEHLELWMMVDAGMTPEEALRSATSVAARCARVDDVGTLEPGKWADFLVFAENPLEDIERTRSLERVYVAGETMEEVPPGSPGR